jgi:hypothetical protein
MMARKGDGAQRLAKNLTDEIMGPAAETEKPAEAAAAAPETAAQPEPPATTVEAPTAAPDTTTTTEAIDWAALEPLRGLDTPTVLRKAAEQREEWQRRERGYMAEIAKERGHRREATATPAATTPSGKPAAPGRVPVEVDDAGNFYVPEDRVADLARRATAPSPEQVVQGAYETGRSAYLTAKGEAGKAAVERGEAALAMFYAVAADPEIAGQPTADAILDVMERRGIAEKIGEHFPELRGEKLEVFVQNAVAVTPRSTRRVFALFESPAPAGTPDPRPVIRPPDGPRSPAARGTGAQPVGKTDQQRLDELMARDPLTDPHTTAEAEEYRRIIRRLSA